MNDAGLDDRTKAFDRFALCLTLLIVAAFAALVMGAGWHGGFREGQALSTAIPPLLWESLTTLGYERVLLALLLPFAVRYPRVFWAVALGTALAALIARGFKLGWPMQRPAAVLDAAEITIIGWRLKSLSFPSGHTASVFAFAVGWAALLGWRRALPLLAMAVVAGFSRVAVGAHWPVDVLGGALAGTLGAWAGVHLSRRFRWGLRPAVHWGLVAISAVAVASLPFDGQGYPGSLPWRSIVCAVGLGAAVRYYLLPLLRGGWRAASLPMARVWAEATKA